MLPYQNLSLEDIPGEVWKDVEGYEGLYQVSSFGRVKSLYRETLAKNGIILPFATRILKPLAAKGWYLSVMLSRNGKPKRIDIHRLVARAFVPNTYNKPCVDHINTNRWDNNASNLRWVTKKENCNNELSKVNYSIAHSGEKSSFYNKRYHARKVISIDEQGRIETFDCIKFVEKEGFSYPAVLHCLYGHQNYHKGRRWMYYEDYKPSPND